MHPFNNLLRKGVIDNSMERVHDLLHFTQTRSVLVVRMRLVNCILSSFRGDCVAWNIAKSGAFSKNRLQMVEHGYSGELQITMILLLNDSDYK